MNYIEKTNNILDGLYLGEPIIDVNVASNNVSFLQSAWKPSVGGDSFIERSIRAGARRHFDKDINSFRIDKEDVIQRINDSALHEIVRLYKECSPNKDPKRTNAYKLFVNMCRDNQRTIDFINSIIEILDYCTSVTKTESIKHESNSIHRKNIHQLLILMEKNYGKKNRHG